MKIFVTDALVVDLEAPARQRTEPLGPHAGRAVDGVERAAEARGKPPPHRRPRHNIGSRARSSVRIATLVTRIATPISTGREGARTEGSEQSSTGKVATFHWLSRFVERLSEDAR